MKRMVLSQDVISAFITQQRQDEKSKATLEKYNRDILAFYSQILSAMLSDGVMYVIICLMSKGFPNLLPGILAIAGQLVLSVLWARGARRYFH